ncbi:MAG: acyl-CoA thioesterase [Acidimicrobiales bacterium]
MFRNEYRVRYAECDRQGVVFNAWYQTYMDDTVDVWVRELDPAFESRGWELMVKRSEILWHDAAVLGEVFALECEVSRWGNTSFDVSFRGTVGQRHCIDGTLVYVVVDRDARPVPVPDELRDHLST